MILEIKIWKMEYKVGLEGGRNNRKKIDKYSANFSHLRKDMYLRKYEINQPEE